MLVKVTNTVMQDCPFAYVVEEYEDSKLVSFIDDGTKLNIKNSLLKEYSEENATLELMYTFDYDEYNIYRAMELNIDKLVIDGYTFSRNQAKKLAKEILDFYGGLDEKYND